MINNYTDIIGWFDFQEVYDLAIEQAQDGDEFLEIGCFMGKSTAYLLQKIKESGKQITVSVIDIFEPEHKEHEELIKEHGNNLREIFDRNMIELGFSPLRYVGRSQELYEIFPDNHFRLIFIDADHEKAAVKTDLNNFYPKVKSGGIFAGHDYGEKTVGVGEAVDEFVKERNLKFEIKTASWVIIKQ